MCAGFVIDCITVSSPLFLLMVVLLQTRSFVFTGILVLTVAPTRSLVGSSTSVFIVPKLTKAKLALASPALAKNQTNDSLHAH